MTLEGQWHLAINHHNPMEPVSSIVVWSATPTGWTLYETSQHIYNHRNGLKPRCSACHVRISGVVASYVGGGFGCKGPLWSHSWLTALAAREVARPVRLSC